MDERYIAGHAQRPELVFLHEGLGSAQLWRDVPGELAARTGCSAFAYSREGNGFTRALTAARGVQYMHDEAKRLGALLQRRALRNVILVGHSDGASIAFIHAGSAGPAVRAIVALAPHVFVEERSLRGIRKARELYEKTDLRERLARHHTDADATFYGWNRIWLDPAFERWNIRDYVRRIAVPVFAIQGADDEYGTLAQIEAVREDVRAPVDVLHLANCGHAPQRDRRATVVPAIAAYVNAIAGS